MNNQLTGNKLRINIVLYIAAAILGVTGIQVSEAMFGFTAMIGFVATAIVFFYLGIFADRNRTS